MTEEMLCRLIPDGVRKNMKQEEIERLLKMDSVELKRHIAEYIKYTSDCIESRTSSFGEYILPIQRVVFNKSFYPSPTARRSYLHLLTLTEVVYGPGYSTSRRNLPAYFLTQTFSGAGFLEYGGREFCVNPGDVMILDCRQEHHFRAAAPEGWGYRLAYFDGLAMRDMFAQISACGSYVLDMGNIDAFYTCFERLFEINEEDAACNEYKTNCILTQMVTEILDALSLFVTRSLPARILEVSEWLAFHCCEDISLDILAEKFNISKFHLSREFKKYMGITVFQYIRDVRLQKAKELLRHTDLPISQICETTHLGSPNVFSRLFKENEDVTPSIYRKQWKGM
ncbi:AraC family transcriptional regulator [Lactonifactor longoviformis]|uniref:AraC-type DNA-binding protein n=1 Tax=Lactonifactor longoviformis DSM 17459 TaxID=1122155 RepID=A0A1M5CHT8_9CLOT|nr:AraC family transcriptional regulator [Lactonifactor longoviformis]POP31405.1 AraC family transcriptional regulator [Lactonifactor longoviformis]SHF54266.1 AraC-type DNA-binding protein [Lactonifactor longoviformis DSM 17459]